MACRRRTGAAFSYNAYFEESRVDVSGPSQGYVRDGQQGRKFRGYFCPTCGTTVYWNLDMRPDFYGVAAGLFEDISVPSPRWSVYEQTKCDWVVLPNDLEHFQQGRFS